LFIWQSALSAAGQDFCGSPAGRFDQSTALFERQLPQCRQIVVDQRGFGI
jgi:hypothetical protein